MFILISDLFFLERASARVLFHHLKKCVPIIFDTHFLDIEIIDYSSSLSAFLRIKKSTKRGRCFLSSLLVSGIGSSGSKALCTFCW